MTTARLSTAAMAGPVVFALLLVTVTALEWDFLRDRGWRLFDHGDVTWPSATALGPYGHLQVANFVVLGLAMLALAVALRRTTPGHRAVGPWLVALMGVGLLLCAFRIDRASAFGGGAPETWNGVAHLLGFVVLLASALGALLVCGLGLRRDPRWRDRARLSLGAVAAFLVTLVGVSAVNAGVGFYLLLVVLLGWTFLMAGRAHELNAASARRPGAAAPGDVSTA